MKEASFKISSHSILSPDLISRIQSLNSSQPEYELYYETASLNSEKAFFTAEKHDSSLAGFLSFLWIPGTDEAELTALVDPQLRKNGIFTLLLDSASSECRRLGITRLYYRLPDVYTSADSGSNINNIKNKLHQYSHSEYLMKLDKCTATCNVLSLSERLAKLGIIYRSCTGRTGKCILEDGASHEIVCSCNLEDEVSFTNIWEVETAKDRRREGLATLLMQCVTSDESDISDKPFVLQVSSRNDAACGLYEKCGFEIISRIDYYCIKCPHS